MAEDTMAQPEVEETSTEDTESDNSADSPTEETNTDSTQSEEGEENSDENEQDGEGEGEDDGEGSDDAEGEEGDDKGKNFADHPRWQKREKDWTKRFNDQETRHSKELQDLAETLRKELGGNKKDDAPTEIPSWFGGEDQAQRKEDWKNFLAWNEKQNEQRQKEFENKATEKTKAEQDAINKATDFMNSEIADIEADPDLNPEGTKIDKNKLFKIVYDKKLVDTDGNWNYRAGFELMRAGVKTKKNTKLAAKKKIASATTDKARGETAKPEVTTTEDFAKPGKRPW